MKTFLVWALFISLFILATSPPKNLEKKNTEITFSYFIHAVELGQVKEVVFKPEGEVFGRLVDTDGKSVLFKTFGDTANPEIFKILKSHNIVPNYERREPESALLHIMLSLLPLLLIIGVLLYVSNKAVKGQSGLSTFSNSGAKLVKFEGKVSFADVAGNDDAKEDLKEIIDFLKDPAKYVKMGARIPKGVLMEGPAGTGKTLLAKACAGEAGVAFFSTSGSDFVEMFVGVGAARARDLFNQGRKNAPCIIFIDEIDAIGGRRGSGITGGHSEREQTLNQILVEMDGFNTTSGVIIMAATNRADVLDPALIRPGRFDRRITMSNPDVKSREAILKVHARNKPIDSSVDLRVVARGTPGFSGADLENLVNEATLLAVKHDKTTVSTPDFENARDKILMGPERKTLFISEEERRITAFHEAGHTLVNKLLPGLDPIHKVTIIPRGNALGVTQTLPVDDRVSMSKDRAEKTIAFLMGGRVAEMLVFNQTTAGASNDIHRATQLARRMTCEWGMSSLGPIELTSTPETLLSVELSNKIDVEIKYIIDKNHKVAEDILTSKIDVLHKLAEALLDKETLTAEEISAITG